MSSKSTEKLTAHPTMIIPIVSIETGSNLFPDRGDNTDEKLVRNEQQSLRQLYRSLHNLESEVEI